MVNCREAISDVESNETEFSTIYPNPFKGFASLVLDIKETKSIAVDIINMQGQVMRHIKARQMYKGENTIEISSEGLTPGMYIAAIIKDGNLSGHIRFTIIE